MVAVMVVDVRSTNDLRDRVLRGGRGHDGFPEDRWPGTLHLGAVDGELIVGVTTLVPREDRWWQLRAMAVEPSRQREGIGRAILADADRRLRAAGATGMWANARDSALGFYTRAGWVVLGEGYVLVDLPHHRVVRDL
jgi:GNAT superfamily N-acetyltransferase